MQEQGIGSYQRSLRWLTMDVRWLLNSPSLSLSQGLYAKPLTAANISKHLEEFGLETEFSTHSLMRGLSGGQKVKVVLGAAMWNNPHMLVLDEPTNYLDRDSLGALSEAIKAFGGGVIMITHNMEFSSALCSETWNVENGRMTPSGQAAVNKEKVEFKQVSRPQRGGWALWGLPSKSSYLPEAQTLASTPCSPCHPMYHSPASLLIFTGGGDH